MQIKNFFAAENGAPAPPTTSPTTTTATSNKKKQRRAMVSESMVPSSVDDIIQRVRRISLGEAPRTKSPVPRRRYSTNARPSSSSGRKASINKKE